jgi:hypothetical protein
MRVFCLSLLLGVSGTSIIAAPLMSGSHIYHLNSKANAYPNITGEVVNLVPSKPLTLTNEITVPNSFPNTVTKTASYSVSPTLSKDGYEVWTKSVKYEDKNGDGCYVQFGWNPVTGLPDLAITATNDRYYNNCSVGGGYFSGTSIVIDNSATPPN